MHWKNTQDYKSCYKETLCLLLFIPVNGDNLCHCWAGDDKLGGR